MCRLLACVERPQPRGNKVNHHICITDLINVFARLIFSSVRYHQRCLKDVSWQTLAAAISAPLTTSRGRPVLPTSFRPSLCNSGIHCASRIFAVYFRHSLCNSGICCAIQRLVCITSSNRICPYRCFMITLRIGVNGLVGILCLMPFYNIAQCDLLVR